MIDSGTGTLYIVGSFKRMSTDPDFKVNFNLELKKNFKPHFREKKKKKYFNAKKMRKNQKNRRTQLGLTQRKTI